jgi:short-subunit dehydrogenase
LARFVAAPLPRVRREGGETDVANSLRSLAVVTGASSGIGYELGKQCAGHGYDLVIAADEPAIHRAADDFRKLGVDVDAVEVDLATAEGVDRLCKALADRPVELLFANAGHGLGKAFLDQHLAAIEHVVDTNIRGTLFLVHKIGRQMRERKRGRILICGSIAGFVPGAYQAVYNATKAFLDSFSFALQAELKEVDVSVTCLMPGPTATRFFERADLMDTRAGHLKMADPANVAKSAYDALMRGHSCAYSSLRDRLQVAIARVLPLTLLAREHAKRLEPGSGRE